MTRKLGYFLLLGVGMGAIFGIFLGAPLENNTLGIALGALSGLFIGWFIGAAVLESRNEKQR